MSDDNRMGDIYDDPFTKILKTKDAEIARLKSEVERLESERRRDALDGQATLDEANNAVVQLKKLNIELSDKAGKELLGMAKALSSAKAEVERLTQWVHDLQSDMYINCVYCGHRYGPKDKVPCSMAEVLKRHVEQCPKHPMSKLKSDLAAARKELDEARGKVERQYELIDFYDSKVAKALKIAKMRSKYPATMTNYYLEHIEEIERILTGEGK